MTNTSRVTCIESIDRSSLVTALAPRGFSLHACCFRVFCTEVNVYSPHSVGAVCGTKHVHTRQRLPPTLGGQQQPGRRCAPDRIRDPQVTAPAARGRAAGGGQSHGLLARTLSGAPLPRRSHPILTGRSAQLQKERLEKARAEAEQRARIEAEAAARQRARLEEEEQVRPMHRWRGCRLTVCGLGGCVPVGLHGAATASAGTRAGGAQRDGA